MTSYENVRNDYFEFHQGALKILAGYAEKLRRSDYDSIIVEQSGVGSGPLIVSDKLTDMIEPDFESSEGTIAFEEEAARLNREIQLKTAQISFIKLQSVASMRFDAEQVQQGLVDESIPPSLLAYSLAEKHTVYPSDGLEVTITKLHGVDHLGEVAEYGFRVVDGPIKHCLDIEMVADEVVDIHATTMPIEDEDYKRWDAALGAEGINHLFTFLTGRFENEVDLNNAISEVWQRFIGTGQEEIIVPLLEEARIRALTAKAAISMTGQFGLTLPLPSADTLEEWDQRLSSL